MKHFILAAVAALSLGIGSAYAAQTAPQHHWLSTAPAYSDDALGGA